MGDDLSLKCGAVRDAERAAEHGHPGQREFADLLDPEEVDARKIEPLGELADDIAQQHADQHIGDGEHQQARRDHGHGDMQPMDRGGGAFVVLAGHQGRQVSQLHFHQTGRDQALKFAISFQPSAYCFWYCGQMFSCAVFRNSSMST